MRSPPACGSATSDMDLDADALRWAKLPALERLARSLGVSVPTLRDEYARHVVLRREVAKAIEDDKRQAAAEERRVMDQKKIAAEIADALGETGKRPRRQIERIVALMGAEWTLGTQACAVVYHDIGDATTESAQRKVVLRADGSARGLGGVFFALARAVASEKVKAGTLTRREFFRCFTDRAPKVRAPKPPPKAKPAPKAKPVRRVETRVPQTQSKPRRQATEPEVYVARRRS